MVQNLDSGKKLSLKKKRIHLLLGQTTGDGAITGFVSKSKLNAQKLVQLIPFMLIKAKPFEPISSQIVKRVLKNSIYYSEEIHVNIGKFFIFFLFLFFSEGNVVL